MLKTAKSLENHELHATDGAIGNIRDLYFDDEHWRVRYFVVDTGSWLTGRRVLISPTAITTRRETGNVLAVNLTKEQVRNSPSVETDKPVSRQYEEQLHEYYAWPYYWGGPFVGASLTAPIAPAVAPSTAGLHSSDTPLGEGRESGRSGRSRRQPGDPHLRSAGEVRGYHIAATDGSIGHIEDLLIDDDMWDVNHVIVDTRNWLPGKKVLLSLDRVVDFDWMQSRASVNVSRDVIKSSPEFDEARLNADYTDRLETHYRSYAERKS